MSAGAGGVVLSLCIAPGILMPLCVAVSAVAGGLLTAVWVHRGQQEAKARLRHPELSGTRNLGGIFGEVTQAAGILLQQYESELQRLNSTKGELEVATKLQRKQARRLDAALRAIDQPVILCDTRDQVLFANGGARQLGIAEAEGMSQSDTFGDLKKLVTFQQLIHDTRTRAAAAPRRTAELNFTIHQQVVPFRASVTALFDDQGELFGTLSVLTDVREEKSAKTRHADFVSSVAHEFKTPMASIKAFLELLVDGDVSEPDEQKGFNGTLGGW